VASTEILIRSAAVPDQPVPPTTTQSVDNLVISWPSVYDGGSPLTSYTIMILSSDSITFYEETDYCNGADTNIMSAA